MANITVADMVGRALSVKNSIKTILSNYGEDMDSVPFDSYPAKVANAIDTAGQRKLTIAIIEPSIPTVTSPVTISWSIGGYSIGETTSSIVVIDNIEAVFAGSNTSVVISDFVTTGNTHTFYVIASSGNKTGISSVNTFTISEPEEPTVEP